jgi:hypothetical protein
MMGWRYFEEGTKTMPCWVVPAVASEIWHIPVDQIIAAVKAGKVASKQENGFTFIDVAPHAPAMDDAQRPKAQRPITYKVVRSKRPDDPIQLPRPAEIITPAERESLVGESVEPTESNSAMGDWRRGRRSATVRRTPPGTN